VYGIFWNPGPENRGLIGHRLLEHFGELVELRGDARRVVRNVEAQNRPTFPLPEPELLDQLKVADAMTTPAICVQHDFQVRDCIRLMRMSGVRSVPVLKGLEPVGILSFTDVLRAATR
jgi:CBS domain-containing protein